MSDKPIVPLFVGSDATTGRLIGEMLAENVPTGAIFGPFAPLVGNLKQVDKGLIDLVLLELVPPESQALATLAAIQAEIPDVPIVVLSDSNGEALAVQAVQAGAQDSLIKDRFDAGLLQRIVHYTTVQHRLRRELQQAQEQNEQLLETERKQRQLAESLREAGVVLSATLDLESVLDRLLDQMARVVPYDTASVMLVEGGYTRLIRLRGYEALSNDVLNDVSHLSFNINTTATLRQLAESGRPLIIPDIAEYPDWVEIKASAYIRSWAGVPIMVQDKPIALFSLNKMEPNFYQPYHVERLAAFAGQAALALQNARLYEAEQHARQTAETLRAANQALTQSLDLDIVLETLLDSLAQLVPYDSASVMLLEREDRVVLHTLRGHERWTDSEVLKDITFSLKTNPILGRIAATQQGVLLTDAQENTGWELLPGTEYIRSWLATPLVAGGRVIGFLALDKAEPGFFTPAHLPLVEALATQTAVAVQNAQLFQAARRNAEEQRIVTDILRNLNASPLVTDTFSEIATVLKRLTHCARVTLIFLDESGESARVVPLDEWREEFNRVIHIRLSDSAAAENILAGRLHITADLAIETEFRAERMLYEAGYRSRVVLPLYGGNQVMGGLSIVWLQPNGCDTDQLPLLQQIAGGIGLGLERSRLFDEIKHWAHQMTILNELGRQLTGLLDARELCAIVVQRLYESFNYFGVSIFTADSGAEEIVLQSVIGPKADFLHAGEYRQKIGKGVVGRAAMTGKQVVVNDTRQQPDFLNAWPVAMPVVILSELALPLRVGNQVVGVLHVDSNKVNAFDENDVTLLTIVADQLAISLEKVHLFEEIHHRTAELEALAEVSAALRATTTVDQIVSVLLHQAEIVGAAFSAIFLIDPESGDAVAQGARPPNASLIGHRYQPGEGITGSVALTGEIRFTDEWVLDPGISVDPDKVTPEIHSTVSLPLRAQEPIVGVMHVGLREKRRFTDEEVRLLTAMAEIAGSALYRAQILQTLEQRVQERTRELAEANEQLKELDRLKSKFVSDVSHELRTPITNLSLYLDLIENGRAEKQAQYLAVLRKQTNRLVNFVEDILSLSRLELSRAQVEFALVDLNTLIEPIVRTHLLRAEVAGLALISELSPDLPPVYGERNQLAQIISILLANGINYTSTGHIRVHTHCDKEKSRVCLEVADTGMGIESSDQIHIFERFYRGEHASQSNIPGTGLGLAILKEIVILHGGEIEVWSEVGVGSTFRVWLPVKD